MGLQFKKKRREFGQFLQKLPVFWTNFLEYFLVSVSLTQYVSCLSVLGNALTIPIVGPFLGVRAPRELAHVKNNKRRKKFQIAQNMLSLDSTRTLLLAIECLLRDKN